MENIVIKEIAKFRKISIRQQTLANVAVDLEDFTNTLDCFMKTASRENLIEILTLSDVIYVEESRLETNAEYDARIATVQDHKIKEQIEKDNSWARQKKKFARAQAKK
jgi:hypothetical protein